MVPFAAPRVKAANRARSPEDGKRSRITAAALVRCPPSGPYGRYGPHGRACIGIADV